MLAALGASQAAWSEDISSFDLRDLPAFSCSWSAGPVVKWNPDTQILSYLGGPRVDFTGVIGDIKVKPEGSAGIYLDLQSYDMQLRAGDVRYLSGRIWIASSDLLFMGWKERGLPRGEWVTTVLTELKGSPGHDDLRFWDMAACRFERAL